MVGMADRMWRHLRQKAADENVKRFITASRAGYLGSSKSTP